MAANPAKPGMLAVGFSGGTVLLSRNEGATWKDIGRGLPEGCMTELAFSPAENRLYVFVFDKGLYWTRVWP
jgi:hypothetical protein